MKQEDRLTRYTDDVIAIPNIEASENVIFTKITVQLANYEDTGLSPEEIKELQVSDKSKEQSSINYYNEMREYKNENEALRKQLETITFPIKLQYGDLTNYIGYGQSETEKLVAITFGVLKEKGSYFGEEKEGEKPLFIAYFDRIESLEVLENLVNIGKARLAELEAENDNT